MARVKVVMPQMGESITSGTITKWHKKPGDMVAIDEMLFEISTEKVESEIPASISGRMEVLHFKEGDTVDVGILIAEIEDDPDHVPAGTGTAATPAKAAATTKVADVATSAAPAMQHSTVVASSDVYDRRAVTPLVKAMAKKAGVPLSELAQIQGTGSAGRVNKEDFETYLQKRGSGASVTTTAAAPTASAAATPKYTASDRIEIIPMDNMRKAIARNMVASKLTSPHVNSLSEVDFTHLVRFREGFKDEFEKQEGFKLTYTPFIIWALIQALKEFPKVNASVDGDNIILKKDINLGVAVAVPGDGLIVPIIKSADNLNLVGICRILNQLANKARQKKLTMDDLQGGTFTLTNVGGFGTLLATPVILQPQVGIYAAGAIQKRPVVVSGPEGDAIAIRHMMYGVHTYDHRLVDGEMGGRFLESVHQHLRTLNPKQLF